MNCNNNELILNLANEVLAFEDEIKKFKALQVKYDEAKAELKVAMEKYGIEKWELPNGTKIAVVHDKDDEEVVEQYFDDVALALDHKDIYDMYLRSRTITKNGRKGYVKITLPKE